MTQKIIFAKSNAENDKNKPISCFDLDKNEYETKYKGRLTCIKGCDAKIKFTERKNNVKFFSTWNKEGNLHDLGCPYHVNYKSKVGRKKLEAYYESIELDDESILRRLKIKMKALKSEYNAEDILHPDNGSRKVEDEGNQSINVPIESETDEKKDRGQNLKHEDANYITIDDIGCRKSVYGFIHSVWLDTNEHGKAYAYFNLQTKHTSVNILLPEAFYSNEYSNGEDEFKNYVKKVDNLVRRSKEPIMAIAYGEIRKKEKKQLGVNVYVISPKRVLIELKTYNEILNSI